MFIFLNGKNMKLIPLHNELHLKINVKIHVVLHVKIHVLQCFLSIYTYIHVINVSCTK